MTQKRQNHNLGIDGIVTDDGLCLTHVSSNGGAAELGLEAGDIIVTVLGYPIRHNFNWRRLLSGDNGYLRLQIRDSRTGALVTRYATLNEGGMR